MGFHGIFPVLASALKILRRCVSYETLTISELEIRLICLILQEEIDSNRTKFEPLFYGKGPSLLRIIFSAIYVWLLT